MRERSAGNASAGIADGLGYLIVCVGVDHEGGAVAVEQRLATEDGDAVHRDVRCEYLGGEWASRGSEDVGQIAGFRAICVHEPVPHAPVHAEMTARGLEAGGEIAAIAALVEVKAVPAGRECACRKLQSNQHAVGPLGEGGLADGASFAADDPGGARGDLVGR